MAYLSEEGGGFLSVGGLDESCKASPLSEFGVRGAWLGESGLTRVTLPLSSCSLHFGRFGLLAQLPEDCVMPGVGRGSYDALQLHTLGP